MIYQTESKIRQVRKYGCYFCTLGRPAEKLSGKKFTSDAVDKCYDSAVKLGYMHKDCYIINPEKIIELYGKFLGIKLNAKLLYIFKNGVRTYCHPHYCSVEGANFFTSFFKIGKNLNGHFVETTGDGKVLFDPYKNSKAVRFGKLYSCRCFKVDEE